MNNNIILKYDLKLHIQVYNKGEPWIQAVSIKMKLKWKLKLSCEVLMWNYGY